MYTWVLYDISEDKPRRELAKLCRQYGLHRVQQSVFMGKAKKRALRELRREAAALVDPRTDKVFLFRTSAQAVERMLRIGELPVINHPDDLLFF